MNPMKFTLERVTQPEIEPVTLAEAKRHLREFAGTTDLDGDIEDLIKGGREWVENFTGRALIDQTWRLTIGDQPYFDTVIGDIVRVFPEMSNPYGFYGGAFFWFRNREILLRKAPVLAIESFVSVDSAGTETTIDPTTYALREQDSKWPRIVPLSGATWGYGMFRLTFRAGFADRTGSPQQGAEMVPVRFKQAIKLWAEAHYDRDPIMMQKLLDAATNVIRPERSDLSIA